MRVPVQTEARGTWSAPAESLRRVDAMPQIVAVERLSARALAGDELELGLAVRVTRLQEPPPP